MMGARPVAVPEEGLDDNATLACGFKGDSPDGVGTVASHSMDKLFLSSQY